MFLFALDYLAHFIDLLLNELGMAKHDGPSSEHQCCGVFQEAAEQSLKKREERRNKPQPWLARKATIGFVIGIIGYAFYVYIGRFCVPILRDNTGVLGGRRIGSE